MQSSFQSTASALAACALSLSFIAPLAAAAQADPSAAPNRAADGIGVARVSVIDGSVGIQRGDASESLAAVLNAPVLGGDYVVSGENSRAELQLDGSSQVRLGSGVQLRFTHLDTDDRAIQLAAGTLDVRLLRGVDGQTAIDTPSITIKPQAGGSYRVTVTSDGRTFVTVRSGDAQIDTPQAERDLTPGTTLIAQGDAANPSIATAAAVGYDDFDRFNADRDRVYGTAQADRSDLDPTIDGAADLANSGRWVVDGSYGHVWVPAAVGPDWAPYRDGRWVWEEGYGWTWVAAEAWGWAPYHYGSWYHSPDYGWCWYPPQRHVEAIWRPALVAFIGFGLGSGLSLGFGGGSGFANIGWVPLAPFEPYHPWWGDRYGSGRPTVVNTVTNITNITNITNVNVTNVTVYKNVAHNAVSGVSSEHFLTGNFARPMIVGAPQLRAARVFRGAIPVEPTASNLRFASGEEQAPVAVRPVLMQRRFAGNGVAVTRTPFTEQRVNLASATHVAITPLHFKDARTTPVLPAAFASPAATQPSEVVRPHPATIPGVPAATAHVEPAGPPATAHVEPAGTPASAWDRFNADRSSRNSTLVAPEHPALTVRPNLAEPARFGQPARPPVNAEPSLPHAPSRIAPTAEQSDRPVSERAAIEHPMIRRPLTERPAIERPAIERPVTDRSAYARPARIVEPRAVAPDRALQAASAPTARQRPAVTEPQASRPRSLDRPIPPAAGEPKHEPPKESHDPAQHEH